MPAMLRVMLLAGQPRGVGGRWTVVTFMMSQCWLSVPPLRANACFMHRLSAPPVRLAKPTCLNR
eukprot:4126894-Alexandrium_andersonii.AAC.1